MRARTILAAAFLAGTSIACSKPASDIGQDQNTGTPAREINLVPEPSPGAPFVSPLEAGERASLAIERAPSSNGERSTARAASVQPVEPTPSAEDARPAIALTEMATPATVVAPNTGLPVAVSRLAPAVALGENEVRETYGGYTPPSVGARGPMILIRGGMGAPDDDCKLHPTRGRGHGIAINNVAPIPGRIAADPRRPSGSTGFTRIR